MKKTKKIDISLSRKNSDLNRKCGIKIKLGLLIMGILLFSLTSVLAAKDFEIKNTTNSFFYVNGSTGKIGIGTANPNSSLNIVGTVNATVDVCTIAGKCLSATGVGNGSVSSITQGTGLTFSTNPITTTGTIGLNTTGVTTGVYGDATHVGVFTVDSNGRLTSASNVTITGAAPGGVAGGDLFGTYPNPSVGKINGSVLGNTSATSGYVLVGSGSVWETKSVSGDATLASTGVLTLANTAVTTGVYGDATHVGVFTVDSKGRLISASNVTITGAAPGGVAGGDLFGTYPNPSVGKINGSVLGNTSATSGYVLVGSGSVWETKSVSGDATLASTGVLTLANTAVTTGVYGDATHVGVFTVDSKGRLISASNVTITGAAPGGVAGGDLFGTYPNPSVGKINGSVLGNTSATSGYVLVGSGSVWETKSVSGDATLASTGVLTLANTAVTTGVYGDATHVGVFTVDSKGRLISASNVTITGAAPGGVAGGDLFGTYPNPSVGKINGSILGNTSATSGYVLVGSGSVWETKSVSGDATLDSTGALTLASSGVTAATYGNGSLVPVFTVDSKGRLTSVTNTTISYATNAGNAATVTNGLYTTTNFANTSISDVNVSGAYNALDLRLSTTGVTTGVYGDATHVGVFTVDSKGRLISASNVTITGAAPGGVAGGDLFGTYPNPSVGKINGSILGNTSATSGYVLVGSGSVWETKSVSGDATLDSTGALTLASSGVTAATYGNGSLVPVFTVDAKGRITAVSNTTISFPSEASWNANYSAKTGTGSVVFNNSPYFTTPTLGAASATTLNTGSGAMYLGDAAVANGDTDSIPTGDQVYDFVVGQGYLTSEASWNANYSAKTGIGSVVFNNSPYFTTPTLGAATATTINKVTITAPASGSTLTIAEGKVLTASNTLTFTGTDSSSVAFGAGGTVVYTSDKLSALSSTSSSELAGVISDETGSAGNLVFSASPTFSGDITFPSGSWNSTGSVGIGTTIPTQKLDVAGNINLSVSNGNISSAGNLTLSASGGSVIIKLG